MPGIYRWKYIKTRQEPMNPSSLPSLSPHPHKKKRKEKKRKNKTEDLATGFCVGL
jgi:hypothetical protein